MAVSKPMQTEFGIHHRLESCGQWPEMLCFSNGEGDLHTDYEQPVKADDPAQIGTSVSNALQRQVDKFTSLYEDAKRAEGLKRRDI